MKSREEVEQLKQSWKEDPCWDIEETEGFAEYNEELLEYRLKCEAIWDSNAKEKDLQIDAKAKELGIEGLYRIILDLQNKIERLEEIVETSK